MALTRVLAYHKPRGLVTTHADELGRKTVYARLRELVPPALRMIDWHAIGRLDLDTTGLLLFTNDGALVHHATQPATHLKKTYRVLAKGLLDEAVAARLRAGVALTGGLGTSAPCEVELGARQIATTWLTLTIDEGKNRQVRRMLLAVGSQVIRLERTHVGGVTLGALPEDGWRELAEDEIVRGLGYTPREVPAGARSDGPRGAGQRARTERRRGSR